QDDAKKPDIFGRIKEVKKAEEGAKGLGTIVVAKGKKGETTDVTIKIGKKAELLKRAGKDQEPTKVEFSDLKEGQFVLVYLREGKEDIAKKVVVVTFKGKKKKAD